MDGLLKLIDWGRAYNHGLPGALNLIFKVWTWTLGETPLVYDPFT